MRAFIVTVIAPNEWSQDDVISSINVGMRKWVLSPEGEHLRATTTSSICTSVTIAHKFDLKRQDI
jgi:hypothetical protein